MIQYRFAIGVAAAFALSGASAYATTTQPAAKPALPRLAAVKPALPKLAVRPVAAKPVAARPMTRLAAAHPRGRMVTTKTSTGKTITYNCVLPGNAAKQACKG